jgi:hypothetical protein
MIFSELKMEIKYNYIILPIFHIYNPLKLFIKIIYLELLVQKNISVLVNLKIN